MLRLIIVTYKLTAVFILYSTKLMICYRSERHMLRLVIVTNQLTSCVHRSTYDTVEMIECIEIEYKSAAVFFHVLKLL